MASTDFAFGLTFDPADKAAAPHAEFECTASWRPVISGIRDGATFHDWKSDFTLTTCAAALAVARREFEKRSQVPA